MLKKMYFSQSHVLNDDQSAWVKKTTDLVFKLIGETPPDGEQYSKAIEVPYSS